MVREIIAPRETSADTDIYQEWSKKGTDIMFVWSKVDVLQNWLLGDGYVSE